MNILVRVVVALSSLLAGLLDLFRRGEPPSAPPTRSTDAASRGKLIAVVLVILGAVGWLLYQMPRSPKLNRGPSIGLGQTLALEFAKVLGDHGRAVVVIRNTGQTGSDPLPDQLAAFRKEMKNHPRIDVSTIEAVDLPADDFGLGLSPQQFETLVSKYQPFDGLVSFVGVNLTDPQHSLALPTRHPKIVMLQMSLLGGKTLLRDQLVTVIIGPRVDPPSNDTAQPKTPRYWFDRYYCIYTAQNINSLPD